METNQYMDMFLDESHEHLQQLNEGLLSLEDNMEDLSVINDIFRNAHTLKGMSATMGYNKIAELTHEMEDVLDSLRHEQLKLTEDIIDTLFKDTIIGLSSIESSNIKKSIQKSLRLYKNFHAKLFIEKERSSKFENRFTDPIACHL